MSGRGINMATTIEKITIVLSLISIILVSGTSIYLTQKIGGIEERLTTLEGTGVEENFLVMARYTSTTTIDPAVLIDDTSMTVSVNCYEPLFGMELVGGKVKAVPLLVEDNYNVSDDLLTWTFKLIEGVKFHDGTEMTSDDVVFSMDRVLTIGKGFAYLFLDVMDVGDTEAIDTYKFAFHLNNPQSQLEAYLTRFLVANKDLIMQHIGSGSYGEFGDYGVGWINEGYDVGSGPYMIKEYDLMAGGTLVKFDDYRGGWTASQATEIIIKIIPEHSAQITALLSGEIDFVDYGVNYKLQEDAGLQPHIVTRKDPSVFVTFITMNCQKPPLDDIYVRRAISYAFDYSSIYEYHDPGIVAAGPVPITLYGYNDDLEPYYLNLTKAQEELAKSKYTAEELGELEMEMLYLAGWELHEALALHLKEAVESLGMKIQLIGVTWPEIAASGQSVEATKHFITFYQGVYYPSPDATTFGMYSNRSWGTWPASSFFSTPELEEVYDEAHAATTLEDSIEWYKEAQEIINENAASIFVCTRYHWQTYRDIVVGWTYVPSPDHDWYAYDLRVVR